MTQHPPAFVLCCCAALRSMHEFSCSHRSMTPRWPPVFVVCCGKPLASVNLVSLCSMLVSRDSRFHPPNGIRRARREAALHAPPRRRHCLCARASVPDKIAFVLAPSKLSPFLRPLLSVLAGARVSSLVVLLCCVPSVAISS